MQKTTIFVRENILKVVEISFEAFAFVFCALKSSNIGLLNGHTGWGIWWGIDGQTEIECHIFNRNLLLFFVKIAVWKQMSHLLPHHMYVKMWEKLFLVKRMHNIVKNHQISTHNTRIMWFFSFSRVDCHFGEAWCLTKYLTRLENAKIEFFGQKRIFSLCITFLENALRLR